LAFYMQEQRFKCQSLASSMVFHLMQPSKSGTTP
jgi:hypothetical protein